MASDKNDQSGSNTRGEQKDQAGQKRVIGEGMTSLDSTQVPLKAETGEPDWEAVKGGKPSDQSQGDQNKR